MRVGVAAIMGAQGMWGKILLGRRGKDPNRGMLVLPGGGVEEGESLEEALRRELLEETGVQIALDPDRWSTPAPILIEIDPGRVLCIVVRALAVDPGKLRDGSDLYDCRWVNCCEVPRTEISPVVLPALLRCGFEVRG